MSVPVFILTDANPYGIEIMLVYKYGSLVSTNLIILVKANENDIMLERNKTRFIIYAEKFIKVHFFPIITYC